MFPFFEFLDHQEIPKKYWLDLGMQILLLDFVIRLL